MHHYISPETKHQLREAVKQGKSRQQTIEEFGVSLATACRWTTDLPKKGKTAKRLRPEEKQRLRDLVLNGLSKYQAAKICDISYTYVLWLTKDIPSMNKGNRNMGERTVEILQDILRDGYIMSDNDLILTTKDYIMLLRYFPVRRVSFKSYTICYLEDRKEEAFRGFIKTVGSRVLCYNKLKELAGLFDLPLDSKMRAEIIGKDGENRDKMFKLSYLSKRSQRRLKAQNPDFIGSFIPSELLELLSHLREMKIFVPKRGL